MAEQATGILKGYGALAPEGVRECLHLFRADGVNIRRLVLLKEAHSQSGDCFSLLEIQFSLPEALKAPEAQAQSAFLLSLRDLLFRHAWPVHDLKIF